jgi:hypothetical protein
MALSNVRGLIERVSPRTLALLCVCVAAVGMSGCAYYHPHTLLATNVVSTADKEAFVSASTRVEAEVCGNRFLWIPFGPDPRMTTVMAALQDQVRNAVGFEDIRIDVSLVNYVFPLFWQECVQGSAVPLFPANKRPAKPAQKAPAAPAGTPQPPADSGPAEGASSPSP